MGKHQPRKSELWTIEGKQVVRTHKHCPKCGPGIYMAEHYDRVHCGKCGYTMFKRNKPATKKKGK